VATDFRAFLTAIFPDEPELVGFIKAKDNGSAGDNWSCKLCKAPIKSSPPTNQHQAFMGQSRMPFLLAADWLELMTTTDRRCLFVWGLIALSAQIGYIAP